MKSLFRKIEQLLKFIGLLLRHLWTEVCQYCHAFFYQYKYSKSPEVILASLRVLTHALDKGMCASNRQADRGYDKYKKCKQMALFLETTSLSSDPSLEWVREKIKGYEQLQGTSDYLKGDSVKIPTAQERSEILSFIRTRRSVRNFKSSKIDTVVLSDLVDVARWAPNSCCRQSLFLGITENPDQIKKCMELTLGATCFSEAVPCFISVCSDMRVYPLIDKELAYIDGALSAGNLLLAAHAYGIEGTVLNWRRHMRSDEKKLKEVLGIAPYYSVVVNIALGYPEEMPPVPIRKNLNRVWKLNEI